jgi:glyoxylase-like metal-dependent hydrolase (beta-lactamase superfamily II)
VNLLNEKITEDIFIVRQEMRPGWTYNVVLVFGAEKIGVVDTGFEHTPENLIFPFIKEKGRRLSEVSIIVNTHRDGDHVQGNTIFKERTGAPIYAHELEMEAVPKSDLKLGEYVQLGDRRFKVIHTPGHRPGAVSLYEEDSRILLTGDSVCGTREDLIRMNKNLYINSLKKLLQLNADMMIMSHPFAPPSKDILKGEEIKNMIESSLEIASNLKQK